jgi:hypothetical protein
VASSSPCRAGATRPRRRRACGARRCPATAVRSRRGRDRGRTTPAGGNRGPCRPRGDLRLTAAGAGVGSRTGGMREVSDPTQWGACQRTSAIS